MKVLNLLFITLVCPKKLSSGRGNNYNSHAAVLPTKHAANKNKDRPFHKTLRNYNKDVRSRELHNVHCAPAAHTSQWILAFYHCACQNPRKTFSLR